MFDTKEFDTSSIAACKGDRLSNNDLVATNQFVGRSSGAFLVPTRLWAGSYIYSSSDRQDDPDTACE